MKPGPLLLVSLLAGCVTTETTTIELKLDRAACASTISSLGLFVLRVDPSSLCTLSQDTESAGSGVVLLPPFKVEPEEVAVLALAYGPPPDGGVDLRDGPRADRSTDGPKKDGPPKLDTKIADAPGPPKCGNFVCEKTLGESCKTCPKDCGICDLGPADHTPPWTDGSASYGLGACVRCYGLGRVMLDAAGQTLKLVSVADCRVPASAPQQANLPAAALPPASCR